MIIPVANYVMKIFFQSKKGRVVMAGDPKQLGPVLYSRLAGLYGLGEFDIK